VFVHIAMCLYFYSLTNEIELSLGAAMTSADSAELQSVLAEVDVNSFLKLFILTFILVIMPWKSLFLYR